MKNIKLILILFLAILFSCEKEPVKVEPCPDDFHEPLPPYKDPTKITRIETADCEMITFNYDEESLFTSIVFINRDDCKGWVFYSQVVMENIE